MTFEDLIAPYTGEHFWAQVWERTPVHIARGQEDYYHTLVSAAEIQAVLFAGQGVPVDHLDLYRGEEHRDGGTAAELKAAHQQGFTLLVSHIAAHIPAISALLKSLEGAYKAKCLAHLVLSPALSNGFAPHSDSYGVFALQIAGRKRWSLFETAPRVTANYGINRHELTETVPTRQVVAQAGDLLYLPRGTVHSAATLDEVSIHLVIAMIPPRGADVLHLLAGAAEADAFFRDYIPYGIGDSDERRQDYAQAFSLRLAHLIANTDLYALLDARHAERRR
jgi:ribosomal protein L16 Arg81 hydroxylase